MAVFSQILFEVSLVVLIVLSPGSYSLKAISAGNLPHAVGSASAVYDGDDLVYIMGGRNGKPRSEILKFNVTSHELEQVGQLLSGRHAGTGATDGLGGFYLLGGLGGLGYVQTISKFTEANYTAQDIGHLSTNVAYASAATDLGEGCAYFLQNDILKYDFKRNTESIVAHPGIPGASTVWIEKSVWMLRGSNIYEYTPLTGEVLLRGHLPTAFYAGSAVAVGKYVYLVGGEPYQAEMVKVNTETFECHYLHVENFPNGFITPSVYVGKLNRIYTFGGDSWNVEFSDILYIQL